MVKTGGKSKHTRTCNSQCPSNKAVPETDKAYYQSQKDALRQWGEEQQSQGQEGARARASELQLCVDSANGRGRAAHRPIHTASEMNSNNCMLGTITEFNRDEEEIAYEYPDEFITTLSNTLVEVPNYISQPNSLLQV